MSNRRDEKGHQRAGTGREGRVSALINRIDSRFRSRSGRASVVEYLRLTQLEQELDELEAPEEIKISWVETPTPSNEA